MSPVRDRLKARRGADDGFAGGAEAIIFGLLIFVLGTLLVANAWGVVDTKMAATAAAEQAARTYVEAANASTGTAGATFAAQQTLSGYGRSPGRAVITVTGGGFERCQRITVSVRYPAPFAQLPFIGRVGSGESVVARHSELIDPFRTGLPGQATCA